MSKRALKALAALGVGLIAAAITMGIVAIWSGDDRWGSTALLIGMTGIVVAFFSGLAADL